MHRTHTSTSSHAGATLARDGSASQSPEAHTTITFESPPTALGVSTARNTVLHHLGEVGVDVDAMYLVALSEILTNAVDEHQRRHVDLPVVVTIDAERELVRIEDRGAGYDPADREARRRVEGGAFGLDLAEHGVPGLHWSATPGGGTAFVLPYGQMFSPLGSGEHARHDDSSSIDRKQSDVT